MFGGCSNSNSSFGFESLRWLHSSFSSFSSSVKMSSSTTIKKEGDTTVNKNTISSTNINSTHADANHQPTPAASPSSSPSSSSSASSQASSPIVFSSLPAIPSSSVVMPTPFPFVSPPSFRFSHPHSCSSSHCRHPTASTVLALLNSTPTPAMLSLSCPILSSALNGGLRIGYTELTGEAGSGKTQLVTQLLLQVQLPTESGGLQAGALYICTEELPMTRLHTFGETFLKRYPYIQEQQPDYNFLNHISIKKINSAMEMEELIMKSLPSMLSRQQNQGTPIRLVVVDSITAVFRLEVNQRKGGRRGGENEHGNENRDGNVRNRSGSNYNGIRVKEEEKSENLSQSQRSFSQTENEEQDYFPSQEKTYSHVDLLRLGGELKRIAEQFSLVLVVTNQVTDAFLPSPSSPLPDWARISSGKPVIPALGLSWSSVPSTRLFLTRSARTHSAGGAAAQDARSGHQVARYLHVAFCPYAEKVTVPFVVENGGVRGVGGVGKGMAAGAGGGTESIILPQSPNVAVLQQQLKSEAASVNGSPNSKYTTSSPSRIYSESSTSSPVRIPIANGSSFNGVKRSPTSTSCPPSNTSNVTFEPSLISSNFYRI